MGGGGRKNLRVLYRVAKYCKLSLPKLLSKMVKTKKISNKIKCLSTLGIIILANKLLKKPKKLYFEHKRSCKSQTSYFLAKKFLKGQKTTLASLSEAFTMC
jgi:hypothetical protein